MVRKKTKQNKKTAKSKASKRRSAPKHRNVSRPRSGNRSQAKAARGGASPGRHAQIHQGVALERGGQSGDIQDLSSIEDVDSESVTQLVEEGQAFEAGIVDGVEKAPDADEGEVRTKEVPEDDISPEYRDYRESDT
jgi:hypothetical protein